MPDFQREIDDAKRLAAARGFGRLTFGWKEQDRNDLFEAVSGRVIVTCTEPAVNRVYERGHRILWLTDFRNDLLNGVFGESLL